MIPSTPSPQSSFRATVLLVDDTPANLGVVCERLRADGLRCLVADSAAAARRILCGLGKSLPDLVLLDVVMPVEDGPSFCRWLKASPDTASLPVIFLTSIDDAAQKVAAFADGAVDYVTKPVHLPELLARVRAQLELAACRRSLEEKCRELEAEVAVRVDAETQLAGLLDRALLLLGERGEVLFLSLPARDLIARHVGGDPARLPHEGGDMRSDAGILRVRRLSEMGNGGLVCLALEEVQAPPGPASLRGLGLTPRQAEVAFWVAHGKTNPEVGLILGASPRTIDKHMERILAQLGLENRGALIASLLPSLRP